MTGDYVVLLEAADGGMVALQVELADLEDDLAVLAEAADGSPVPVRVRPLDEGIGTVAEAAGGTAVGVKFAGGGVRRCWYADRVDVFNRPVGLGNSRYCQLNPETLAFVAASDFNGVGNFPRGCGGSPTRLYTVQANIVDESPTVALVIFDDEGFVSDDFEFATPSPSPSDIGGDDSVAWMVDDSNGRLYELEILPIPVSGLTVIRSVPAPKASPQGVGGTAERIWLLACDPGEGLFFDGPDPTTARIYEIDPITLAVVRTHDPGHQNGPGSIGGGNDIIYYLRTTFGDSGQTYVLSPVDFSVLRSAPTISLQPRGIGGK